MLADLDLLDTVYTSMPRVKITFEYRRTLYFMDDVEVTVGVAGLGRTSVTFSFECTRDGETCVEGELVAVQVDEDGSPRPWSETVRAALSPA